MRKLNLLIIFLFYFSFGLSAQIEKNKMPIVDNMLYQQLDTQLSNNENLQTNQNPINLYPKIQYLTKLKTNINTNTIFYRPSVALLDDCNSQITYTYDTNGNIILSLSEKLINGVWENSSRTTNLYDANGNKLTILCESWTNGAWVNYSRYAYTYDFEGKELTMSKEYWENGDWTYAERYNYTYNTNGTISTEILENWGMGGWCNVMRRSWTYDAQGYLLTELHEFGGINSSRITYTYDTQGNKVKSINENWDNGVWVNSRCNTSTYNLQGNKITDIIENWNNGVWVNSMRYDYTYDAQGNKLTDLWEHWRNGSWVDVLLRTYTYDDNNNGISGTSNSWNGTTWVPYTGPIDIKYNNNEDLISIYAQNATVKYVSFTGVENFENLPENFTLSQNYPNPFNPSTTISFGLPKQEFVTLKIYDVLGKEITTLINQELNAGNYQKNWSPSEISSGVYFYKLQAGNFIETRKMNFVK